MKRQQTAIGDAKIETVVDDTRWTDALGDVEKIAGECYAAAAAFEPGVAGGAALLFADDVALRDLNRRFRGKDAPTNVLSFPTGCETGGLLGDIAIAFETCRREAEEQGIAFRDHAAHLIVHGLLHLAGHDHEAADEAERMELLETRILAALAIADPYEA